MRKLALLPVLITAIFFSCVKQDDIQVLEVEELRLESFSTPVVTLLVRNGSGKNIQIQSGKFSISTSSGKIGEVMLTGEVVIPKKAETSITLPLKMRISNPLAAAPLLSGGKIETDRIRVTGEARVKAGAAKRTFHVEDAPLSRFMDFIR